MSDPGYSSTEADFYDLHLRELTMQGFFTRLQTGDRRVIKLVLTMKVIPLTIWEEGDPIDNVMMMEQFINDKVLSDNQQRRARNRRSQSPILNARAASITATLFEPGGGGTSNVAVEYEPRLSYVFRYK